MTSDERLIKMLRLISLKLRCGDSVEGDYLRILEDAADRITALTWEPIETIPKDGTTFLGVNSRGHMAVCHWDDMHWSTNVPCVFPLADATHWLSLPHPPESTGEKL